MMRITTLLLLCAGCFSAFAGTDRIGGLPVAAEVDVAIVGANEAALAAAFTLGTAGRRVCLLNDYSFLAGETLSKDIFDAAAEIRGEFARRLFGPLTTNDFSSKFSFRAESLLEKAGVKCLYNTRPAGVVTDDVGGGWGVVTANKAGKQIVLAKMIIDATPGGTVASELGGIRLPPESDTVTFVRTQHTKLKDGRTKVTHREKTLASAALDWPSFSAVSWALCDTRHRAAAGRFVHTPAFIWPSAFKTEHTCEALRLDDDTDPDVGVFRPTGVPRVYVVGAACGMTRACATDLMNPRRLAWVGEKLAKKILKDGAPAILPARDRLRIKSRETPVWGTYDVIVAGSGTSGHAAAIAAGRAGMRVLLLEQSGFVGGSVTLGIKGFWRGWRRGFNQEWKGTGSPVYLKLLKDAKVDVWLHTQAIDAVMDGNKVKGLEVATWMGLGKVLGKVIIDATGDGDVCVRAGAKSVFLNDGDLCLEEASFIGQDLYANMVPVDPSDVAGMTRIQQLANKYRKKQHFPYVQIRQTRQIVCDVMLNVLDVDAGRTWHDVVAVAGSAFDPHGFYSDDYSFAGLMPQTKHVRNKDVIVSVPLRALIPVGLENIFVTGRAFSATHDVQAIVRMNPDTLNMGYATGYAAALCVKNGTTTRGVDLAALQKHLFEIDNLPREDAARITRDMLPPSDEEIKRAAEDPGSRENLLTLARAGARAVEPLKRTFASKPSLAAAHALALLGDRTGVPLLAEWLAQAPLPPPKPYAWDGFLTVPAFDSTAWTAAITEDGRIAEVLAKRLDECNAETAFNTLRVLTVSLGRIGDVKTAPHLAAFLKKPGIAGHTDPGVDPACLTIPAFPCAMTELFAAAALVQCGDYEEQGARTLSAYLNDCRGVFSLFAKEALKKAALKKKGL